jgi:hypothetical protein
MSLISISLIPLTLWGLGILEIRIRDNNEARALFFISYCPNFGLQLSVAFLGKYQR